MRGGRPSFHGDVLGLYDRSLAKDLLRAGDDDLVGRIEAGLHHVQAIDLAAQRDVPAERRIALAQYVDIFVMLVGHDGFGVYQKRRHLVALQLYPGEKAGRQQTVGIRDDSADTDRAGRGIDLVVEEIHGSRMWKTFLVRQTDPDRISVVSSIVPAGEFPVAQKTMFIAVEIHIHGILRDQGCQHGLVSPGKITRSQICSTHATCDWCTNLSKIEIEFGSGYSSFRCTNLGSRLVQIIFSTIELLTRYSLFCKQCMRMFNLALCKIRCGSRTFKFCLCPVKCISVRTRIDDKEKISGFDLATFLISNAIDVAADAWTQFHRRNGMDAAVEFVPCLRWTHQYACNRDIGRWWFGRRARSGIASDEEGCRERGDKDECARLAYDWVVHFGA